MRASNEPATSNSAATTTSAPRRLPAPTGRDVLWTLLGGLGGMVVGLLVGLVPALLLGGLPFAAVGLATSALGGLAGLWLALVRRRGWGWRELGFTTCTPSAWNLLWEVPLWLVAALACTATIGLALGVTPQPATEQDLITDTITAAPWSLVLGGLCIVVLVPVVEEVVFRRVLLGWLRTRVPAGVAVMVASAGFAAAHLAPVLMVYTFFVGLAAALLFLRHRSLWASLALHATNNAIATVLTAAALTS